MEELIPIGLVGKFQDQTSRADGPGVLQPCLRLKRARWISLVRNFFCTAMAKTLLLNIKDLKISHPSVLGQVKSSLKCNVILVAKFDFTAETKEELSVSKGDVLKLLDRLSNGWVLVKFIDKMHPPGLVPCLYVDIAVNDTMNPITLGWLHQNGSDESKSFVDAQVKSLLADNVPLTINNTPYPLTVLVSHYLTYDDRFWYRVDVIYSTGQQGYLCRYYQDFYDLHALLLDMYNAAGNKDLLELKKPPKLPEPVPSNKRNLVEMREIFSNRCRELSTYMNELILNKNYQVSPAIVEWLDKSYCQRPGFVVDDALNDTNEGISQRILPGSVTLASESKLVKVESPETKKHDDSPLKFVLPAGSGLQRSKTKNIYNHYHQAANFGQYPPLGRSKTTREPVARSASTREPLRSISQKKNVPNPSVGRSRTITAVTAGQSMEVKPQFVNTPQLPSMEHSMAKSSPLIGLVGLQSPQTTRDVVPQIKCKIKTQTSDILVVMVQKKLITSLDEFKNEIYRKVAFNNLFIKLPNSDSFQEIDSPEINAMLFLHQSDRVLLLVT